jgi:hypothetical protein
MNSRLACWRQGGCRHCKSRWLAAAIRSATAMRKKAGRESFFRETFALLSAVDSAGIGRFVFLYGLGEGLLTAAGFGLLSLIRGSVAVPGTGATAASEGTAVALFIPR